MDRADRARMRAAGVYPSYDGGFGRRSSLWVDWGSLLAPTHETSGESEIERLFREEAAIVWPTVPALVQEHWVTVGGQSYRLDFAVPSMMLAIELDGHATHSSTAAIAHDRKRQRDLEDAGWKVRRYGGQEVTRDAGAVVLDALRWAGLQERVHDCDGPEVCPSCDGTLAWEAAHEEWIAAESRKWWVKEAARTHRCVTCEGPSNWTGYYDLDEPGGGTDGTWLETCEKCMGCEPLPSEPFEPVPGQRAPWMPDCNHVLCDDDGGHFCDGRERHSGQHRCGDSITWDTGFDGEIGRHRWDATSSYRMSFELTPEQQRIADRIKEEVREQHGPPCQSHYPQANWFICGKCGYRIETGADGLAVVTGIGAG